MTRSKKEVAELFAYYFSSVFSRGSSVDAEALNFPESSSPENAGLITEPFSVLEVATV